MFICKCSSSYFFSGVSQLPLLRRLLVWKISVDFTYKIYFFNPRNPSFIGGIWMTLDSWFLAQFPLSYYHHIWCMYLNVSTCCNILLPILWQVDYHQVLDHCFEWTRLLILTTGKKKLLIRNAIRKQLKIEWKSDYLESQRTICRYTLCNRVLLTTARALIWKEQEVNTLCTIHEHTSSVLVWTWNSFNKIEHHSG